MTPILTGTVRACERCQERTAIHKYEIKAVSDEVLKQHPYMAVGVHYFCKECIDIIHFYPTRGGP